jgi:DNA-binding NarL/FixJ family response regulator
VLKPIRVVLVGVDEQTRAELSAILQEAYGIEIVARFNDENKTLFLVGKEPVEIVLLDNSAPENKGPDLAELKTRYHPQVRFILLASHIDHESLIHALRTGASGYLLKDTLGDELELAIRAVAGGDKFLCPVATTQIVAAYMERFNTCTAPLNKLTPRQREVFHLLVNGNTTQAIAHTLKISPKTVETHRLQLMERLSIHDVPGLVRLAIRCGIVSAHL